MNIALLLTGYTRTYKDCYLGLKNNLIDKFPIDIYYSTWSLQEDLSQTDSDYLNKLYNPKKFIVINQPSQNLILKKKDKDIFLTNRRAAEHGIYWADRLSRQWTLIHEGFKLIPNNYDFIVRMRFDLLLHKFDTHSLLENSIYFPSDIGGWDFTDHMAYGTFDSMKIYSELVNNIQNLYDNDIDITHAVDMPKTFLTNNKIFLIENKSIKYSLWK